MSFTDPTQAITTTKSTTLTENTVEQMTVGGGFEEVLAAFNAANEFSKIEFLKLLAETPSTKAILLQHIK